MKWIAKRILLKSYNYMDISLTQVVLPFIEKITREDGINDWYCSRKTESDASKPSVRVYLKIKEKQESNLLSKLEFLLQEKKDIIGWTGKYNDPDPALPNPSKPNLKQIQKGCEIALKLMKFYPDIERYKNKQFLFDLKGEFESFLDSMNNEYDFEAIHFIANNLGLKDDDFIQLFLDYTRS